MTGIGYRLLEMAFGTPSGPLGKMGGRIMAHGNAGTEQHLVGLANLAETDVVLVIGPGPGVGLHAAGQRSAHVIGLDPSRVMLNACRRRCADLVKQGRVRLVEGVAADTGQPPGSVDVVLAVNNVQIWPDQSAGLHELHRVLRPHGRLLISVHQKWLPGGLPALAAAVEAAGFTQIDTWTWEPPGCGATTAAQLSARRSNRSPASSSDC